MLIYLRKIGLIANLATIICVFSLVPIVYAETDVTAKVELIQSRLMFDRSTSTSYLVVSVKNISDYVLPTPIKVVIDSISTTDVRVANADGTTEDGKPYFEYTVEDGQLSAGASTTTKRWSFTNTSRVRFSYTTCVLSGTSVETINGIIVPSSPDETENSATIKGVDSNNDGIRDDVERLLAQEFGSDLELYEVAKEYSSTLQAAITNPTSETIDAHLDSFRCINDEQRLTDLDETTKAILDTLARRGAYGSTFAGAFISSEGCQ